jgi:hypothetical protein
MPTSTMTIITLLWSRLNPAQGAEPYLHKLVINAYFYNDDNNHTSVVQLQDPLSYRQKGLSIGNSIKIKTNWMQQITVFIDLQDQLNMFRTKLCPSSGA